MHAHQKNSIPDVLKLSKVLGYDDVKWLHTLEFESLFSREHESW